MKKQYEDISGFLNDVKDELSVKQVLIDMGIISKSDFLGQFVNCKFHDEKTPSMQITDNFWKCYGGCGLKGDLVKFLESYYNTDFVDAVKKLAEFLNVNIADVKYKFDDRYVKLKNEWNRYLANMEKAPAEIKAMRRDYFPHELGYDSYNNYVVLALTSKTGSILGFTKRRIGDDEIETINGIEYKRPKWKHSSLQDSMIAQCHNMFNLFVASPEIRKKKFAIVGEGPKDVIAYQRIDMNNAVCVCGTSNSNNIWDLIFPVERIVLSMDLDDAGIKATIKTVLFLAPTFDVKNIESVVLPEGKDPYDIITTEGGQALKSYYEQRIPAVEFVVKYATDDDIRELYGAVVEYNRIYVMKTICRVKGLSVKEAESWLASGTDASKQKEEKQLTEKEKLLAFVNGEDVDGIEMMDINKAQRILLLKYGIKS